MIKKYIFSTIVLVFFLTLLSCSNGILTLRNDTVHLLNLKVESAEGYENQISIAGKRSATLKISISPQIGYMNVSVKETMKDYILITKPVKVNQETELTIFSNADRCPDLRFIGKWENETNKVFFSFSGDTNKCQTNHNPISDFGDNIQWKIENDRIYFRRWQEHEIAGSAHENSWISYPFEFQNSSVLKIWGRTYLKM